VISEGAILTGKITYAFAALRPRVVAMGVKMADQVFLR